MDNLFRKRALLITGKGGVGRTTLTAALALAAARQGKRVLIAEIGEPDVDYSPLGAIFGSETLPQEPVELAPGIQGVMIWSRKGHERFLRMVLPIPALVRAGLRSRALRRMLDAAPSLNELGVFYHMLSLVREEVREGEPMYDLFILDLPATGHALGLASLPENILKIIPSGPIHRAMEEGYRLFFNPELSSMYVVTLPEMLPVTECLELIEGLRETEMPVGGVFVNKVLVDGFTVDERLALAPMLQENDVFGATRLLGIEKVDVALEQLRAQSDVPRFHVPERSGEGIELAEQLSHDLLNARPQ